MDFRTRGSYGALIAEIDEQFQLFRRSGYAISLWQGEGQSYRDSREMRADVRRNRRLFVYPTSGLSSDHPLAKPAKPRWWWNDFFRAVHDLVGHSATGFQFGAVGEDNAFRFHTAVHSAGPSPRSPQRDPIAELLGELWAAPPEFPRGDRPSQGAGLRPARCPAVCRAEGLLTGRRGRRLRALGMLSLMKPQEACCFVRPARLRKPSAQYTIET